MASRTEFLPPKLVVDTSVILKWVFVQEEDADKAYEILNAHAFDCTRLLVPSTFFHEAANTLTRAKYKLDLETIEFYYGFLRFIDLSVANVGQRLLKHAMHIAYAYKTSLYDALFLALAQREQCDLVTADRKAWRRFRNLKQVHLLSAYRLPPLPPVPRA